MSDHDPKSRARSRAVGKRSGTEHHDVIGIPGRTSGTSHLEAAAPEWDLAARLASELELGQRQLLALQNAQRGEQGNAEGQAWILGWAVKAIGALVIAAHQSGDEAALTKCAAAEQFCATAQKELSSPTAIAAGGLKGGSQSLPHLERIQASFGRHDVSGVKAFVGGAAKDANHQLGAHAFAMNGSIAFAETPDLHTAAHEAAHIVQQRAGVALKGALDQPGDEYERHADQVADAVVRGESAEPLLARMTGRGADAPHAGGMVQRKVDTAKPSDELEKTGYVVEDGGKRARIKRSWLREKLLDHWFKVLGAMQEAGAVSWAAPEAIERFARRLAAKHPMRDQVISFQLDAIAIAIIGLPPGAAPTFERVGNDILVALPGIGSTGSGETLELDAKQRSERFEVLYRALETYVGLPVIRRIDLAAVGASSSTAAMRLHDRELSIIFGPDAWATWRDGKKKRRNAAATTPHRTDSDDNVHAAKASPNELDDEERERVSAWFAQQGATPREINRDIYELVKEIENDPKLAEELRRLMHDGGASERVLDAQALRSAIDRARVEAERSRLDLGTFKRTLEPYLGPLKEVDAFETADVPARLVQRGLGVSGRPMHFELVLDWSAYRGASDPAFDKRHWQAAVVEWVIERTDNQASADPERFQTEHAGDSIGIDHAFALGPNETRGTWTVHAFVHTSHFAPKHAFAPVEVKTEQTRMAELRREAFGGMGGGNATTSAHRFDIGGGNDLVKSIDVTGAKSADSDGSISQGDLPADFQARDAESRGSDRVAEIERTQQLIEYLERMGEARYSDALKAAERRLERLKTADADVRGDEARGWESFEIRATYLGLRPEVASGPLDFYGSVRREHIKTPLGDIERVFVQIRDHSQRLGPDLTMYLGEGASFESALEQAFVSVCKDYPEGRMSVVAQVMDASGAKPRATRKFVGFELSTTSPWKRVKDKLYDPTAQTIINVAATALMVFQPELAPVILPILTIQNTIANVDELVRRYENHTLKSGFVALTLAQIGLDLLPFARGAKILQTQARLVAFEAANIAGMAVVMGLRTSEALAQIQDADIGALAEQYRELIELQRTTNPSDPDLARRQREIDKGADRIRQRVAEQWTKAIGENGIFLVGSHVLADTQRRVVAHSPQPGHIDADAEGLKPITDVDDSLRASRDPHAAPSRAGGLHETIMLAGDDQQLRAAALRAQPRPGYVDVFVHGSEHSFWLVREQVDIAVDHRALGTYLEKHGLAGARLRLVSCETGKSRFAVAQDLANKLHVEVLAPSEAAWINAHGDVGVGPRDVHRGQWHTFKPKDVAPAHPRHEAHREPPPMRTVDGSEVDAPTRVTTPRVDTRARIRSEDLAMLSDQLGVKVSIDRELHNGVEVRAERRTGVLGYDITSVEIRVGSAALHSDVLAHAKTIAGLRRYNGLVGKLKRLADRLFKGRGPAQSKFPPGSRGYVTEMELAKLGEMIDARHAQHAQGLIDQSTLFDEITFLEGQVAFHQETLQSLGDTGYLHDASIAVGAPDIGAVTRDAQAAGYKLPGEIAGVGAAADPNHYYYRRSKYDATVFELAVKPSAPADAPSFRARVVNGKFQGIVDGAAPVAREVIPHDMAKADVISRLRETEGFGPYAEMLEQHGIASPAVIDTAVTTLRGRKNAAGDKVTLDWLRHEVKSYFRKRVEEKLLDTSLDDSASYRNMRSMLDGLGNPDRGNLAEVWYAARHAKGAKAHVPYQIRRTTGENAGLVEKRIADLRVGSQVREVKDIEGKIDEEQLGAYLDVLRDDKARKQTGIDSVRYVFTKREGAIANLERFAEALNDRRLVNRLVVEVFDASGATKTMSTRQEVVTVQERLKTNPGLQ